MTDTAQWFEFLGFCRSCGKQANGIMRSTRAEHLGMYCEKCADDRLVNARAQRLEECKRLGREAKSRFELDASENPEATKALTEAINEVIAEDSANDKALAATVAAIARKRMARK